MSHSLGRQMTPEEARQQGIQQNLDGGEEEGHGPMAAAWDRSGSPPHLYTPEGLHYDPSVCPGCRGY
jgi:hypothetical protein